MPISNKYKTIFVHIPKTGGAAIEKTLGIFGSDNNGCLNPNYEILYGKSDHQILHHLKLNEIKDIKKKEFKDFKLVSFVRNPYDRIVSEYLWRLQVYGNRKVGFKEFLNEDAIPRKNKINKFLKNFYNDEKLISFLDVHYDSQISFLMIDNKIEVKNIGKFEKLAENFELIFNKKLIHQKIHRSKSHYLYYLFKKFFPNFLTKNAYRKYYDNETYDLITKHYDEDIKEFNYIF